MKKIKIIIAGVIILAVIALIGKSVYLNSNTEIAPKEYYEMNEEVAVGKNYFNSSLYENADGYYYKITSAYLMTFEEFCNTYALDYQKLCEKSELHDTYMPEYVINVNFTLRNTDNEDGGLSTTNLDLYTDAGLYKLNDVLFNATLPQLNGNFRFSIKPNTSFDYNLAYSVDERTVKRFGLKKIQNKEYFFPISQYPIEKYIKIKLEDYPT